MRPSTKITIFIPTARANHPKRGTLANLVLPVLKKLPVGEVIVAGLAGRDFLKDKNRLGVPVRMVTDHNTERAHLRNLALRYGSGSHVMYLDDDTIIIPHPGLSQQITALRPGEMLAFADRLHLHLKSDLARFWDEASHLGWSRRVKRSIHLCSEPGGGVASYVSAISFPTNFCILHKDTLAQIGGLDESYRGWGYEDVDFGNRILKAGRIVVCRKTATAVHIAHHINPELETEAYKNYLKFLDRVAQDSSRPNWSAMFFGVGARVFDSFPKFRPAQSDYLERALVQVPHLARNPKDRNMVVLAIQSACKGMDLLAVSVIGSAARREDCRDLDLSVIAGYCKDQFVVAPLPSGKRLELHLTSLSSISRQLQRLYYLGDNAFLLYYKFSTQRFLYDYRRLTSRFVRSCLNSDPYLLPYLMSFYVGLTRLYLEKRRDIEQLSLGRFLHAVSLLAGTKLPDRQLVLDPTAALLWFEGQCEILRPRYARLVCGLNLELIRRYPPNFIGDEILSQSFAA